MGEAAISLVPPVGPKSLGVLLGRARGRRVRRPIRWAGDALEPALGLPARVLGSLPRPLALSGAVSGQRIRFSGEREAGRRLLRRGRVGGAGHGGRGRPGVGGRPRRLLPPQARRARLAPHARGCAGRSPAGPRTSAGPCGGCSSASAWSSTRSGWRPDRQSPVGPRASRRRSSSGLQGEGRGSSPCWGRTHWTAGEPCPIIPRRARPWRAASSGDALGDAPKLGAIRTGPPDHLRTRRARGEPTWPKTP